MKTLAADLRVLSRLLRGAGGSSAADLEKFYGPQAEDYDQFRERLLHGRRELIERLTFPKGGMWLDLGAGTGANLDYAEERIWDCRKIVLVDLCRSLLAVAEKRVREKGWKHVECRYASVFEFEPEEKADLITFSYSLTMMPQWRDVIERAYAWLKPGGTIGVVDFYVSGPRVPRGRVQHSWWTRTLWRTWFSWDGVHLNGRHLSYFDWRFKRQCLLESRASVPYLPMGKVPYYLFIGTKV